MSEDSAAIERACPLCRGDGGRVLLQSGRWRIVLADEASYPAFTRIVWQAHVAEMSELPETERRELFDVVLQVESVQRRVLAPAKINLASLGNQVAHLHWHVIPRWRDDLHFPASVWSTAVAGREAAAAARSDAVAARLPEYIDALQVALKSRRR